MTTQTKRDLHEKAVLHTACTLIENGIVTRNATESQKGIDLVLDNGKTVLVRGLSEEKRVPITHDSKCELKADYIIVATNLRYMYARRLYILKTDNIDDITKNYQVRATGKDNWFINATDYRKHTENYDVLTV